jgi:hypothetical protein
MSPYGTKVKAAASPASFHGEGTRRQHLEEAWERARQMGDPRQDRPERSARQRQAQEAKREDRNLKMEDRES